MWGKKTKNKTKGELRMWIFYHLIFFFGNLKSYCFHSINMNCCYLFNIYCMLVCNEVIYECCKSDSIKRKKIRIWQLLCLVCFSSKYQIAGRNETYICEVCRFAVDVWYWFDYVQVKTTNPKKYCVRPNTGIVSPRSTCDVIGAY